LIGHILTYRYQKRAKRSGWMNRRANVLGMFSI
jgi:hypothetical protein